MDFSNYNKACGGRGNLFEENQDLKDVRCNTSGESCAYEDDEMQPLDYSTTKKRRSAPPPLVEVPFTWGSPEHRLGSMDTEESFIRQSTPVLNTPPPPNLLPIFGSQQGPYPLTEKDQRLSSQESPNKEMSSFPSLPSIGASSVPGIATLQASGSSQLNTPFQQFPTLPLPYIYQAIHRLQQMEIVDTDNPQPSTSRGSQPHMPLLQPQLQAPEIFLLQQQMKAAALGIFHQKDDLQESLTDESVQRVRAAYYSRVQAGSRQRRTHPRMRRTSVSERTTGGGSDGDDKDEPKGSRTTTKDTVKDENYWERRRKNNEAAKRSRDQRRAKEDEIAQRAHFLESENIQLKLTLQNLSENLQRLQAIQLLHVGGATPQQPTASSIFGIHV